MRQRRLRSLVVLRRLALATLLASACVAPAGEHLDPRTASDLAAAEQALADRDDARARALLAELRERHPSGAALARVERLERVLADRELGPYAAVFDALDAALHDRDEAAARRILLRLTAGNPPESVLERAQAYDRIIEGRELVASLALSLGAEATAEPGVYRLWLDAGHALPDTLRLRCPTGYLSFLATGVGPSGIEQRSAINRISDVLADLELAPGAARRLELGTFTLAVDGLIASRGRWELRFNAGTVARSGRELPAMRLSVEPTEMVRFDRRLPTAAVEPSELVRYVAAGAPSTAALLERAVRIDRARRDEALDALSAVAAELPDDELARLVPALRWLGGERELGGDPRAWRQWLRSRVASSAPQREHGALGPRSPDALAARR